MELYTIDPDEQYNRAQVIDEYESLIWTERFIEAGDFRLVIPATRAMVKLLAPGTLLGVNTSRELMLADTRSIEEGMLTVTGKTVENFFKDRFIDATQLIEPPGQMLGHIVQLMQDRNGGATAIPGLRTGPLASGTFTASETIEAGEVYNTLLTIAKKYSVGMAVYWVANDANGHDLVFSTRVGVDRTRNSPYGNAIMFSPDYDNLANVKELLSEADAKTTIVVYPPKDLPLAEGMAPVRISTLSSTETNPFKDRVIEVTADGITADELSGDTDEEKLDQLRSMMRQRGNLQIAGLKRTKVVDGELTPESQYRYYTQEGDPSDTEYRLGDTVEIAGNFTDPIAGVMSEYIQSADATGSRAYPSVVAASEFVPDESMDT
jgi:hypothetical protein